MQGRTITHPPSVPQAIIIHKIVQGQETQAKLTKPEQGTDLGKVFSEFMCKNLGKNGGSEVSRDRNGCATRLELG